MEVRTLYCDSCKEKIDEMNFLDLRMFNTKNTSEYQFFKNDTYLTSGTLCKKCSNRLDKKIKELFKEMNFKYQWNEKEED